MRAEETTPPPAEGQAANQRVIIAYTPLNHDT